MHSTKRDRQTVIGKWLWAATIVAGAAFFGGYAINLFVSKSELRQLEVPVPILLLVVIFSAALLGSGKFTIAWFKSLSPAVLIASPGLRESTNAIRPIHSQASEDMGTGFPPMLTLNVGSFRISGLSGPGHSLVSCPRDTLEVLSNRLAIVYAHTAPTPDRVYRGIEAISHDIAMKSPHSGFLSKNGKIHFGLLDSRTQEAGAHGERLFDMVLSTFGALLGEMRDVARGGIDRKIEALRATSKALRKKSPAERLGKLFSTPEKRPTEEADEYADLERGRRE